MTGQLRLFQKRAEIWRGWNADLVICGICHEKTPGCECEGPVWFACEELRRLWEKRPTGTSVCLQDITKALYPDQRGTTPARRILGMAIESRYGGRKQEKVSAAVAVKALEAMGYDPVEVGL